MRRKLLIGLLCISMVASATACGSKEKEEIETSSEVSTTEQSSNGVSETEVVSSNEAVDNSNVYFDIKYGDYYDTVFTKDNMKYIVTELSEENYVAEEYSETDDFLIYKVYLKDSKDSLYSVFVAVKDSTEWYSIEDLYSDSDSSGLLPNIDTFINNLVYLGNENEKNVSEDDLQKIGYTKTAKCLRLGFYIPEEVEMYDQADNSEDGHTFGKVYYQVPRVIEEDDTDLEEDNTVSNDSTSVETTISESDKLFEKILGYYKWEDDENNGISISTSGVYYDKGTCKYEISITRGDTFSDIDLVSFSDDELDFEKVTDYGTSKYIIKYIDDKTIQVDAYNGDEMLSSLKGIKSE